MPLLPSGHSLYIGTPHILEPGTSWFPCPAGHFWYQTPDLPINAPPFQPDQTVLCDFVHAPVPKTREEAARYVRVFWGCGERQFYWRGECLADFGRPEEFTDADWVVWQEWTRSDSVTRFLDQTISLCQRQAEANAVINTGRPPVFYSSPEEAIKGNHRDGTEPR